jgi:hypothetical protein
MIRNKIFYHTTTKVVELGHSDHFAQVMNIAVKCPFVHSGKSVSTAAIVKFVTEKIPSSSKTLNYIKKYQIIYKKVISEAWKREND